MSRNQDLGRRGDVAAVPAGPATPNGRRPRVARLVVAVAEAALMAMSALALFLGLGIVGNPWYRIVAIEGGSMAPTISRGDLIVVTPAPARVEPGMILVVTVGGETVTHRAVAVSADGTVVTRGDANGADDTWDGREVRVVGRYVATIPWLGRILPVPDVSGASFVDRAGASMHVTVGTWVTPPTPAECAGLAFSQVFVGTEGDDSIEAGTEGALVFGLGGSDTIRGGNGRDCLVGGDGDDLLAGGNGKDVLLGGDGDDTLYGDGEADEPRAGTGKDLLDGGDGIDACYGTGKDTFEGCETVPAGVSADPGSVPEPPASAEPDPDAGTSPTPQPDPGASSQPTLEPDPGASSGPAPTQEPSPAHTPAPAPTPAPTQEPSPAPTPAPTQEPSPAPTPAPTPEPPAPTPRPPTADFTFSVSGLTVSFTNRAKDIDTWTWDFGDGDSSTRRSPDHTYTAAGTYAVTLRVVGADGATAAKTMDVTVAP